MILHRLSLRRGAGPFSVLILLAVLALLAALLLPAIQKVREAANRMRCANNLKQMGIAAHNYFNDFNRFPSGYYGPVRANGGTTDVSPDKAADRGPWVGSLVPLLPYVEQDVLYKSLWKTERTFPAPKDAAGQPWLCGPNEERKAWWTLPQNVQPTTGQVRVPTFECPSDKVYEHGGPCLVAVHIANGKFQYTVGQGKLGLSNYAGVAGAAGDFDPNIKDQFGKPAASFNQWIGILYNRSTTTFAMIADGTSNTLLFGESLGGEGVGQRGTAWTWFGVGTMGTAYGLARANVLAAKMPDLGMAPPAGQDGAAWYRFGSYHTAVNFAFADGSVRTVRFGKTTQPNFDGNPPGNNVSDWAILQQLAGCRDGFANDTSAITD